jgi:hypothetical protein
MLFKTLLMSLAVAKSMQKEATDFGTGDKDTPGAHLTWGYNGKNYKKIKKLFFDSND